MTTIEGLFAEYLDSLEGDFTSRQAAIDFADRVEVDHAALLARWHRNHFIEWLTNRISHHLRSERSRLIRQRPARRFAESAKEYEEHTEPDEHVDDVFRSKWVVDEKNTRRPLGDMTAPDLAYVAADYEVSGRRLLAMGALFRAVEKKVRAAGTGAVVRDVFTQDEYLNLVKSITGEAA